MVQEQQYTLQLWDSGQSCRVLAHMFEMQSRRMRKTPGNLEVEPVDLEHRVACAAAGSAPMRISAPPFLPSLFPTLVDNISECGMPPEGCAGRFSSSESHPRVCCTSSRTRSLRSRDTPMDRVRSGLIPMPRIFIENPRSTIVVSCSLCDNYYRSAFHR